jgi:hypothetical protein
MPDNRQRAVFVCLAVVLVGVWWWPVQGDLAAGPRAPAAVAGRWRTFANGDDVLALAVQDGVVWAGTRAGGLVRWDLGTGTYRQSLNVNVGISTEKARELVKFIKGTHIKVQSQVQDDQVRVSGKTKDDLQAVIRAVKDHDFEIALQFVNFRP